MTAHEEMYRAAKALMDSVNFDMVGVDGRGGNGGLISTDTMRRSDELRQIVLRYEAAHTLPEGRGSPVESGDRR